MTNQIKKWFVKTEEEIRETLHHKTRVHWNGYHMRKYCEKILDMRGPLKEIVSGRYEYIWEYYDNGDRWIFPEHWLIDMTTEILPKELFEI
jgi:hypothetical protein